ncbi:MAG TPA: STAS domain-containing protein [Trebonia sp.]|jgi:anti-anti-sigma factor|nr:STAS domain-containing protein [Trebonia sp.]
MALTAFLSVTDHTATIELAGELDSGSAPKLHRVIEEALRSDISCLELQATELTYMSSAGLRALLFARQKLGDDGSVIMLGAPQEVARTVRLAGLEASIKLADT